MKLQTIVESVPLRIKLRPDDRTMVLGSCFALCLGDRMRSAGFNVCSNPFGVLIAGIFYSALTFGGSKLNLVGAPTQLISVIIGTVVYFISISTVLSRLKHLRKEKTTRVKEVAAK